MLAFIQQHFAGLADPRVARSRVHSLHDILAIAVAAVLCGAEGWEEMAAFGRAKAVWLRERLGLSLEAGIPCPDTFRRVFARLDPEAFEQGFRSWVATLRQPRDGQVLALDGQVLRHSFDTALGQGCLHLVRVWATQERLVLGTVKVAEGSNEIPAAQDLLDLLDLSGSLVTADAMHCQKESAEKILQRGGHYLLALKDNQAHLHADVALCFEQRDSHPASAAEWQQAAPGRAFTQDTAQDFGHDRQEVRTLEVLTLAPEDPDWQDVQREWKGLRSLVRVRRTRTAAGHTSQETAYYLCSEKASAQRLNRATRQHWDIENGLHWVLDVSLGADASRVRRDNGPQNLALVRSVVLNLLRRHPKGKRGLRALQKLAGWDEHYLQELIA